MARTNRCWLHRCSRVLAVRKASQARRGTSKAIRHVWPLCSGKFGRGSAPVHPARFLVLLTHRCHGLDKNACLSPFLAAGFPEPFTAPLNFSVEHRLLFNVAVRFFFKKKPQSRYRYLNSHHTPKDPSKFGVVFEHSKFP